VCCGCIEETYRYKGHRTDTETVDLAGVRTVELRLGSADVEVVTGNVGGGNFIIRKTYYTNDKDYGDDLLRDAEIKFEKKGATLYVTRPKRDKVDVDIFKKGYVRIDMTAMIPGAVSLDLVTGSGDLDIDDRDAPVKVRSGSGNIRVGMARAGFHGKSGSGDIRLSGAEDGASFSTGSGTVYAGDIAGDVKASSGSGDISIESLVGDLDASTGSGDIWVDYSEGEVSAETGSGDIEFSGHRGSADLSASSGDIDFYTAAGKGEVRLRTSSGDIDVVVYNAESIEIDVSTTSGSITSQVPIVVKEATRKRLRGISGGGDWQLRAATSSGDITVKQGSI
jgi:DUF4097 and DUF4098 domain-containing protein YvlB